MSRFYTVLTMAVGLCVLACLPCAAQESESAIIAEPIRTGAALEPTEDDVAVDSARRPAPPTALSLKDKENDAATAIEMEWVASPDGTDLTKVAGYIVRRAESTAGPYQFVARIFGGQATAYTDGGYSWDEKALAKAADAEAEGAVPEEGRDPQPALGSPRNEYYYEVIAFGPGGESESVRAGPISPEERFFHRGRLNVLLAFIVCGVCIVAYIRSARQGTDFYVRPLAGLEAVDDAIGRATEMGKSILFVAGLGGVGAISTIAAMTILGRVARITAEHGTRILVPCNDPLVMTALREVVKQSYLEAGRPDAYNEDDIFFTTGAQFAYVASVAGIMLREKPAANFYMGYFFAESLILAEAGGMSGAIQIVGTDAVNQLPFFVTTCDYTLMGEELYAATAYLSREPRLLGSLKAQDLLKLMVAVVIVLGCFCVLLGGLGDEGSWMASLSHVTEWLETH